MMKSIMLLLLATFPLLVPTVRADEKEDVAKVQRAATEAKLCPDLSSWAAEAARSLAIACTRATSVSNARW